MKEIFKFLLCGLSTVDHRFLQKIFKYLLFLCGLPTVDHAGIYAGCIQGYVMRPTHCRSQVYSGDIHSYLWSLPNVDHRYMQDAFNNCNLVYHKNLPVRVEVKFIKILHILWT